MKDIEKLQAFRAELDRAGFTDLRKINREWWSKPLNDGKTAQVIIHHETGGVVLRVIYSTNDLALDTARTWGCQFDDHTPLSVIHAAVFAAIE